MQEKFSNEPIFFRNLRFLINKNGVKNATLAKVLKVHRDTFTRYLSKKTPLKPRAEVALAEFFNVDVEALRKSDLSKQEASDEPSYFVRNLRFLINRSGKKHCEIAAETGINKVNFSNFYRGKNMPNSSSVDKIAAYFGVSTSQLLSIDLAQDGHGIKEKETTSPASSSEEDDWKKRAIEAETRLANLIQLTLLTNEKLPPIPARVKTDSDFAALALNKTAELQNFVNRMAAELLESYNKIKR